MFPKLKKSSNFEKFAWFFSGQTPVMRIDQPLFAIAKEIQRKKNEVFGETQFVVMMGDMQIEMNFMKCLVMYFWLLKEFSKILTDLWNLIKSPRVSIVSSYLETNSLY